MRKLIILVLLLGLSFSVFSGCKSRMIKDSKLEEEMVPFVLSDLVMVGFIPLADMRPQEDISYMTSVSEKVSAKILDTLKRLKIFDEIHSPATGDDGIIITGEIRKFQWKSFDTMISYIPGLNVLPFFGLPSTRVHSEVDIYLEIKNNNTGKVILGFNESYSKDKKYNIYNFQPERAEVELAGCFDIVLKRINNRIKYNRNRILEVAKAMSIEAAKLAEKAKVKEEPEVEVKVASEEEIKEPPEVKVEEVPTIEVKEKVEVEAKEAEVKIEAASKVKVEEIPRVEVEEKPEAKAQEALQVKTKEAAAAETETTIEEAPEEKVEEAAEVIDPQEEKAVEEKKEK